MVFIAGPTPPVVFIVFSQGGGRLLSVSCIYLVYSRIVLSPRMLLCYLCLELYYCHLCCFATIVWLLHACFINECTAQIPAVFAPTQNQTLSSVKCLTMGTRQNPSVLSHLKIANCI